MARPLARLFTFESFYVARPLPEAPRAGPGRVNGPGQPLSTSTRPSRGPAGLEKNGGGPRIPQDPRRPPQAHHGGALGEGDIDDFPPFSAEKVWVPIKNAHGGKCP